LTEIGIAPSLIYGVLNDVFGQDIAAASFKKLVEEFHGDVNGLMEEVEKQAEAQAQGKAGESEFNTGVGVFVVHSGLEKPHTLSVHHRLPSAEGKDVLATPRPITENPAGYEHMEQMKANTERVRAKIAELKENQ